MTDQEKQVLRAYLEKPDAAQFEHNGQTLTIAEWVGFRDDAAVARALNDADLGASLGKTVERAQVPATEVKAEIAASTDFATLPASVMQKLEWFISSDPFPMSEPKMRDGVAGILEAFVDARAKFLALSVRSSSIAESLIGRAVSTNEVSEALA